MLKRELGRKSLRESTEEREFKKKLKRGESEEPCPVGACFFSNNLHYCMNSPSDKGGYDVSSLSCPIRGEAAARPPVQHLTSSASDARGSSQH